MKRDGLNVGHERESAAHSHRQRAAVRWRLVQARMVRDGLVAAHADLRGRTDIQIVRSRPPATPCRTAS